MRSKIRKLAGRGTATAIAAAVLVSGGAVLAATVQQSGLRISALAQIRPYKLPRESTAPISMFVAGHLSGVGGAQVPQLRELRFLLNRNGVLHWSGLPACEISDVQPASTQRALSNCGSALIGSGQFWANIVLPDQGIYHTQGRLLVFNGGRGGKHLILAHIFTSNPFNTSYVIPFSVRHVLTGVYGTELKASLPTTFGTWGYIDRIKLNLERKYRYGGERHSVFNAGCAAPAGAERAPFSLAYAEFKFARRPPIAATVSKTCGVEG
jgi:hypothetical protein